MPENPWSHWYWNDWDGDEQLKLCSLAAQGLWMRMLSIAARADPAGYVAVKGRPCSPGDIATLTGSRIEDIEPLLSELRQRGVFSVAKTGAIYNRRMVKDEKKRQKLRKNGGKGGRARALKQREKFDDLKQNSSKYVATHQASTESTESTITTEKKERDSPDGESQSASQIASDMIAAWREEFTGTSVPIPARLTRQRIQKCGVRLRDEFGSDLEQWRRFLCRIRASPFLLGDHGWVTDFDWCLKPENIVKILEGNYDPRPHHSNGHAKTAVENLYDGGYRAALAWEERERTRLEADEPLLDGERSAGDSPGSDRGLD